MDKHHGKAHVALRMLWRQKYGVAGHNTFILRKRERRVIMLTCFLPFIHHPMAWCYLHSGCISPPQLNLSGNASDASSLPVLLVIPNRVKVPTIELSQLLSPNTDVTTFKGRLSFGSQFWRVRFFLCWPQDLGTSTVSWQESKGRWGCSLSGQEAKGRKTTSRIDPHCLKTSLLGSSL